VPTSDDEADRGVTSRKNEGFSDDDLSDPEQDGDSDQDMHTLGNKNAARPGDERVRKKNNTRNAARLAKATRNKARAEKGKVGEATAPRQSTNPYRLQLKFGKVVQNDKTIVNVMDHVSEFMQHWNLIDEEAELTNLSGDHRHWTYKAGKAPRTPSQVKHCVHAFYNKSRADAVVLNTTIEITSTRDFWSTQKQMVSIHAFLKSKQISVHMVALDILHEVCVGILTETSSILRHDRNNICAEIRGLCNIPASTPLGVHEFRRKQPYGSPTNKYQVESTALALYTDIKNLDDVKELCNMNIQEGTKNRLFLPIGSTMLPHHPTNEVPPEIHEKLIIKHNRRLESLSQGSIKGLAWAQAETKLRVIPTSKFAAAYPRITSISAVELLGMVMKRPGNPTHSISRTNTTEKIINYDKLERASAEAFISGFKN
jgi:hypothetical protein